MKAYKAFVQGGSAFYVTAKTPELAYAEAVNICARLFLQYGLQLKAYHVQEVGDDLNRSAGRQDDVCVEGCAVAEDSAGAQASVVELGTVAT